MNKKNTNAKKRARNDKDEFQEMQLNRPVKIWEKRKSITHDGTDYLVEWTDGTKSWLRDRFMYYREMVKEFEKELKERSQKEDAEDNDRNQGPEPEDFAPLPRAYYPENILGITNMNDELHFLVKWTDCEDPKLVPAREANKKFADMVIDFYESRIIWENNK